MLYPTELPARRLTSVVRSAYDRAKDSEIDTRDTTLVPAISRRVSPPVGDPYLIASITLA